MGEPHSDLESGLVDLQGLDPEQIAGLEDSAFKAALLRLIRDAEDPEQATAGFQASI